MKNVITRLNNVEIQNFKNVSYGTFSMPLANADLNDEFHADILGIYGQNGSGKTSVIEATSVLQSLLSGHSLKKEFADYISKGTTSSILQFGFLIKNKVDEFLVEYKVEIQSANEGGTEILKEALSFKKKLIEGWSTKVTLTYNARDVEGYFTPTTQRQRVLEENRSRKIEYTVAIILAQKERKSAFFSSEMMEIIASSDSRSEFSFVINALHFFADARLFVIDKSYTGVISLDAVLPFAFLLENTKELVKGDLAISLEGTVIITKKQFGLLKRILDNLNVVIKELIPGLTLETIDYGAQLTAKGEEGERIELVTQRGEHKIPIKYESEGIKKIISILSALIAMYNNPSVCVVVDELDAGVFEYLLGELLKTIEIGGKGQLIFTSHNLRPLEMIRKESLIFTTTNPSNRYIQMKNIKENNNLRDLYIKSINLGGQKEEIYKPTNNSAISRAFRSRVG